MPRLFSFLSPLSRDAEEQDPQPSDPKEEPCPSPDQEKPMEEPSAGGISNSLNEVMRQMQHARAHADLLLDEMSELRIKAEMAAQLKSENLKLAQHLNDSVREVSEETQKRIEAERALARSEDSLSRVATRLESASKEVSTQSLEVERTRDMLDNVAVELRDTRQELQNQSDARKVAEVEAASLRTTLTERDSALQLLTAKEAELRLQAEKDKAELADANDTLSRTHRLLMERKAQCEDQADTISQLEQQCEATQEELRALEAKQSDLKLSHDARIYTLNSGHAQEQEGHRITRKLLDEMRASSQDLADENKYIKDQAASLAQENQQMKLELGSTRSTIREYGEQLKESHLRYTIAQDDVLRLESSVEKASKETRTLKRQAEKAERLTRENTELQVRISSLQQSLKRYRKLGDRDKSGNAPIPLRAPRIGELQVVEDQNISANPQAS